MNQLIVIILFLIVLLCIAYVFLIARYCYAWHKMKSPVLSLEMLNVKVSVVIAARNEENTIENCIYSILKQSYESDNFEIIIIDDASDDTTNKKVQRICEEHKNVKLITLNSDGLGIGKKHALNAAIHQSQAELIVTTDADCIMETNWLRTIVSYYKQTNAQMIVAPVVFYDEKNIFEKLQTIEFMSLMVCSGASLYFNEAIMCNGANLGYKREVFYEVNGFEGINNKASGDDVLLMYKVKERYTEGVKFLKHKDAFVYTKAKKNIKEFIAQRKRWSSKGFNAMNPETKVVGCIVFLFNISLLILPIASLFFNATVLNNFHIFMFCCTLFFIKCIIDFSLLFSASSFFNKRKFLIYFIPEQLAYIFYVSLIGFIGSIGKYEWKGRKTV